MKISSTFHISVLFMAVMIFCVPFVTFAQWEMAQTEQERAVLAAWRDAEASVDKRLWFLAGCFGNFWGYLTASTYHRPIPTVSLLGKSPEYVAYYTDAYRAKTSELQMANAGRGVCLGCVLYLIPAAVTMVGLAEDGF